MLKSEFPAVHVVSGDGSLFWGGGMRKAWELAANTSDFDYFLWLNDDTFIHSKGLFSLIIEAEELPSKGILSAACRKPGTQEFSYGGLDNFGGIVPNGSIQKVLYINGNLVLIPREVYQKIGAISHKYTHYLGDYDYGLRAQKAGFDCFTTSAYLAECDVNDIPYWGDPELKLKDRWNMAHDIKGLAISEYISYKKYHFGKWVGFKTWLDSYLKVLSPQLYIQIRNFFKRALNPN